MLALAMACSDSGQPDQGDGTGSLRVTVVTTGTSLDTGYELLIDEVSVGAIAANEARVLSDLPVGDVAVRLTGVAENCLLAGAQPVSAEILEGEETTISLQVSCYTPGAMRLTVTTTGPTPDDDGYLYGIDAPPSIPIAINDTTVIGLLSPGEHLVRLGGLADNCTSAEGYEKGATVPDGDTVTVTFAVECLIDLSNRIVFRSDRAAPGGAAGPMWWTVKPDGSDSHFLEEYALIDGDIAFGVVGTAFTISGDLWYTDLLFGFTERLTTQGGVDSPDWAAGQPLLAYSKRAGASEIYDLVYIDVYAMEETTIGSTAPGRTTRRFSPQWSSNDQRLVFGTDSSLNSINVDGSDEQIVVQMGGPVREVDWSHTSDRIAFTAPPVADPAQPGLFGTGAWTVRANGQGLTQVMSPTANVSYATPRWNPVGDRLTFSRTVGGVGASSIWVSQPDGSGAVEVAADGDVNVNPVWP
jgi:hypothetical protein